nr:CD44 antigen isoform X12 [Pogona vitticeps]
MAKFWLCAAVGFYLLPLCLAQIGLNISCRYAGVFHVEKNRRYSLTREDAVELCKALNSTIPTLEQMQKAFALGFETCRYGYIEDKVVVPRHTPYHLCAANNTGIYILASNISDRYDTYCFNSSETREKVCDPVIKLYSVLPNNNNTIEIFNADGSHYIEGEKYTDRPPVTEDETSAGSGSANDRGTTEPNFIRHGVSQYPHPADSSTIPYLIGRDDEVSDNYEEGNSEDQHPKSTTVGVSNNGEHHDNATQGQQVLEDFPLWWSSKEHEERHKTTSRKDESTEENDDDGGGDDGDDDNEEGSGQINRETVLEWNNSGDQEPPPSNTTAVVLSKDIKNEDSAHDSFLHGVHSEKDSEVRYSTNGTKEDVPPGIGPLSDDEHYPTTTVVPSSSTHYEDSSHDTVLHREHSEWDSEEKYLTNTSGEYLLPGIIHPTESDHEKESSHTVQSSSNDAKHEDAMRDPMLHQEQGREDNYHTNNTEDDIFLENIPPTGYSSDEKIFHTVIVHNDPEDSTQEPLPPTHQPGWDPEEKYPTNTSRDDVLVEVDTDSKNEHDLSFTDVVFHGTKEDSTLEPVSQWGSEDQYTTQSPADVLVPGIVPRRGINQKNKTDHTVGVSSDGAKGEESTQHPPMHGLHPGGSNNGEVNNTEDYRVPGVFSEVGSDSDRRSSTSTASINPEEREGGVSHTGKNVTPLPGEFPKSQPRKAHIPDWLIVVASLLALALILGVCIAVNSRRRCGQKKKLVINNGKGGIDEKNVGGLNGEASKSQEMVHLVHKEKPEDQTGSHDEFLAIDETQNQQDVALKSGI